MDGFGNKIFTILFKIWMILLGILFIPLIIPYILGYLIYQFIFLIKDGFDKFFEKV